MSGVLAACVPPPTPATRLDITTLQTWCGGVIPPPGEPWCHTNARAETVVIRQGRTVIDTVTTDAAGRLKVDVAPGTYVVAKAAPEVYEQCTAVTVTAVAEKTTPVTQECTIMAP